MEGLQQVSSRQPAAQVSSDPARRGPGSTALDAVVRADAARCGGRRRRGRRGRVGGGRGGDGVEAGGGTVEGGGDAPADGGAGV